jgi:deazaflavin-dependent oxidoreductase (nitroreductase family)
MTDPIAEELASWGKVLLLETRGRVSGAPLTVAVGFVERPDGSLEIAAGEPDADWALNLRTDPRCTVTIGDGRWGATANELEDQQRNAAIRDLILRYGTPSEGLGRGPAFALVFEEEA